MDVSLGRSCKMGKNCKTEKSSSFTLSGNLLGNQTTHQNFAWLLFLLILNWNLSSTSSFCPPLCSCDDVALLVDCHSAGNLRVVPIFLNPQIKFLSLARNQIKDVALSLQFYSELQVLDISENSVETLGTQNFEILKNLRVLNASYNAIKVLENGVFAGLMKTEILDLQGNQMERVEREIFWNMENIREIILDRNRLDFLDWDLFRGLDKLEKISARFNFLQMIEPSQSLVRGGGGNLGGSTWTLKNVRVLDVSWNQLTRVKDHSLVIFGALKELNLCCNYIHTLEEKAFSPGQLERVNLSQNRLGRVPTDALEKLGSSLRQLDLSSNRISDQIPKNAFRSLVHVETIRVSDNPSVHLINREALIDNTHLVTFEADYLSNLTQLPATLLQNKPFLQTFSVKYAQISSLSEEFFHPQYSQAVKSLDLTGNPTDCNCSAFALFQFLNKANVADYDLMSTLEDHPHNLQITDDFNNYINSNNEINSQAAFNTGGNVSRRHLTPNTNTIPKNTFTIPTQFPSHLFSIRCQQPEVFAGILVKDLKHTDFEHCFSQEDHFQIMVICIAAAIVSLIFLTLAIKLCCVFGVCSACRNKCCNGHNKKEKPEKPEKLFDSMIVLRRDLPPTPTPNFNANVPNGKTALGTPTHMLYCNGNGNVVNGNGNGSLPMGITMDYNGYHHHQQQHTPTHMSRPLPHHQLNQMSFSPQKQIHQHQPPVILHYEYPDFPSMHRVKQVPSVLV